MSKRVVVTGGTGFVGANLVRRLLSDGHNVHLFVRNNCLLWRLEDVLPELKLHYLELCDQDSLATSFASIRPDWIFHLAAFGNYSWQENLETIIETNFLATVRLVEAARKTGFECFINTGSSAEYGFKAHPPKEDEFVDPNSYYSLSKVGATHFCRVTASKFNLNIPTLRLYSAFGAWEEPRRLMPTLIRTGLSRKLPPLVDPDTARDFIYIDDVVDAYMKLAAHPVIEPGIVFNVGSGVQTTIREAVAIAKEVLKIDDDPNWGSMPNRAWDTGVWYSNSDALRRSLAWSPKYTFREGFIAMVEWAKSNPQFIAKDT